MPAPTQPDATQPDATEPDATQPDATQPDPGGTEAVPNAGDPQAPASAAADFAVELPADDSQEPAGARRRTAAAEDEPVRTPRKRAPRKPATAIVTQAETATAPPAPLEAADPTAAVVPDAGAPTAEDAAASAEPADPATQPVSRAPAAVAVAFQAPPATDDAAAEPEAAPARRRRRAGTSGAVSPAALVPTLLEPVPAAAPDDQETDQDAGPASAAEDDDEGAGGSRRRRRGRRGRGRRPDGEGGDGDESGSDETADAGVEDKRSGDEGDEPDGDGTDDEQSGEGGTRRRRRRRRRGGAGTPDDGEAEPGVVVHVREPRSQRVRGASAADEDGVRGITGSTRMAAKRVRRQEGRDSGRRRQPILSEAEFLARREAVERVMVVRQKGDRTQIAVLEDGVLVEHYVTRTSAQSFAGNVYLGRVQNVLPSMEAAFVDIGKGRNAVLYAGEVNWADFGGGQRKIETALKGGQEILVQVSKEPIGTKGARLTGQVSLPGRYLVYVPQGSMTGISRKLPDTERDRLKAILKKVVPDDAGVIIRTAAEGASEEEIAADVRRLQAQWEVISTKAAQGGAPKLLHAEPDLVIRVIRDVFNEDFASLVVQGDSEWETIRDYVEFVAPDLAGRLSRFTAEGDVFAEHRIDEQLAKALDRKVWLPSGGSLVIDRTEAMVVIDVNTGKYTGQGGNLEETVTRNNLEAAEEIARQLRLRDLGGIIVVDFIDMVLESNRDLVVRRLAECMARDRTKHQVAEVTSLGLVQMTRKRVGQGLLESFSEPCDHCGGRGVLVRSEPVDAPRSGDGDRRGRGRRPDKRADSGRAVDGPRTTEAPASPEPADGSTPSVAGRRRRGRRAASVTPAQELAELTADPAQEPGKQPVAEQGAPGLAADLTGADGSRGDALPESAGDAADAEGPDVPDSNVDSEDVRPAELEDGDIDDDLDDEDDDDLDDEDVDDLDDDLDDADDDADDDEDDDEDDDADDDEVELVDRNEPPATVASGADPTPAPRRRRRATSRPAGPPGEPPG